MKSKAIPGDIPGVEPVIDCFDAPEPMMAMMRLIEILFPCSCDVPDHMIGDGCHCPSIHEEIAMLLKCVYISGVFAQTRALTGWTDKEIQQHLHETWDRIYWMQQHTGEA